MSYIPQPQPSGSTLVGTRDQIRTNFELIKTQFEKNHVSIQSDGKHKFLQMPNQETAPSTAAAEIAIYSKDVSGVSNLYFKSENPGSEYRATSFDDVNIATFGTNTTYAAGREGGWTFLPGGLVLQYGRAIIGDGTNTINFPKAFSSVAYSVTIARTTGTSAGIVDVFANRFTLNSSGGSVYIRWQSVGSA